MVETFENLWSGMISPAASCAATTPCRTSEGLVRYRRSAFSSAGSTVTSGEVVPLPTCRMPEGIVTEVAMATVTPLDQAAMIALAPSASTILRAASMAGVGRVFESRSEEHTSELQSLMRISYAVFCLKKKKQNITHRYTMD